MPFSLSHLPPEANLGNGKENTIPSPSRVSQTDHHTQAKSTFPGSKAGIWVVSCAEKICLSSFPGAVDLHEKPTEV